MSAVPWDAGFLVDKPEPAVVPEAEVVAVGLVPSVVLVPLLRDPVFGELMDRLQALEVLLHGIDGRLDSFCRDCGCDD